MHHARVYQREQEFISAVLNRTNTFTGVQYKNDKAVLAWETGNELFKANNVSNAAALLFAHDTTPLVDKDLIGTGIQILFLSVPINIIT